MPYRIELFRVGQRYHIYNRGFQKQQLFYCDADYARFLSKLTLEVMDNEFRLHAYVLMPNHFHLLLEPTASVEVSDVLRNVQLSYAKYFCLKYKKVGSVFGTRFKVKRIDSEEYLFKIVQYIHQNPVLAKLVGRIGDWRWSSFWSYFGDVSDSCVTTDLILSRFHSQFPDQDFREFNSRLNTDPDQDDILIDSPTIIQSRD